MFYFLFAFRFDCWLVCVCVYVRSVFLCWGSVFFVTWQKKEEKKSGFWRELYVNILGEQTERKKSFNATVDILPYAWFWFCHPKTRRHKKVTSAGKPRPWFAWPHWRSLSGYKTALPAQGLLMSAVFLLEGLRGRGVEGSRADGRQANRLGAPQAPL